jgi:diguanylate cyclase (GGDEF)-like protein
VKIVIVEDDQAMALWLRVVLDQKGHQVRVAHDGEAAWELLRGQGADLVLSDWVMPRLDGVSLCRRIRSEPSAPYVYFVLLTCREGREHRLEGLRAGADDLLTKPVDPDELEARLEIASRILAVHEALARRNTLLSQIASTDALTGVKNRRRFAEDMEHHTALMARHGQPLSLMMIDVDRFKAYNDDFGHPAGDDALRRLAATFRLELRESDVLSRYGGEEFAVLLPGTDAEAAREVGERLRSVVAAMPMPRRPVTVSIGIATAEPGLAFDPAVLVAEADSALYRAKRSGRDRVVHSLDPEATIVLPALAVLGREREAV